MTPKSLSTLPTVSFFFSTRLTTTSCDTGFFFGANRGLGEVQNIIQVLKEKWEEVAIKYQMLGLMINSVVEQTGYKDTTLVPEKGIAVPIPIA